jgi:hypothetical protein
MHNQEGQDSVLWKDGEPGQAATGEALSAIRCYCPPSPSPKAWAHWTLSLSLYRILSRGMSILCVALRSIDRPPCAHWVVFSSPKYFLRQVNDPHDTWSSNS